MPKKKAMSPIEAVHTAARNYCIEQAALWQERDAVFRAEHRPTGPDSEEALAIYPRYQVLDAILEEVERMTPADFTSLDDAVEWLLLAGDAAQHFFTRSYGDGREAKRSAIQDERTRFAKFVQDFVSEKRWEAVSLPYRRTLSGLESQALWASLEVNWKVSSHSWYPIDGGMAPPHCLVFCADTFIEQFGKEGIAKVLSDMKIKRVFALKEFCRTEPEREMDAELIECYYHNGNEGYWTTPKMDWLMYASHECTLTIAGKTFVETLVKLWPEYHSALDKNYL